MTTMETPAPVSHPSRPLAPGTLAIVVRLGLIAGIGLLMASVSPGFITADNFLNILRQASLLFLVASGLTLVIIGGGLDLSIGANLTLCACLAAAAMKSTGQPMAGVAVALSCGILVGLTNGLLINRLRIPAFLATFGMLWVTQGIAFWFMAGQVIYGFSPAFRFFGSGFLLGVPVPIWIMVVVGLCGTLFLS